jgi:ATP-dependent RNA helicase RhlB
MEFASLSLPEPVMRGIEAAGFTTCTPIQEKTLPIALEGKDVAGQAQTGTGKTAAYLIVLFTRLLERPRKEPRRGSPRALIIAPTRELAVQIERDAELLGQFCGFKMVVVYGGVDYAKQREAVQGDLDILVGTPGRLIDYFRQGAYDLKSVEVLVIDEADRMFDMGFIKDLRYMLRRLPPYDRRQSFLFSATLPHKVLELGYEHMNNPVRVAVSPEQVTPDKITQVLYHVARKEKFSLLLGLLMREKGERILMFVNTKREAERLTERLNRHGYPTEELTGDIEQKKRLRVLEAFKRGEIPILVATDVASRGLHIEGVTHVVNYDIPQDSEDYVHRVGRTARAGAAGKAISLADEEYVLGLEAIEKLLGFKIPVEWPDESLLVKELPRDPTWRPRERPREAGRGRERGRDRGRDRHPSRPQERARGPAGPLPARKPVEVAAPAALPASAGVPAATASPSGGEAQRKRRRRRKRRGRGGRGSEGQGLATPQTPEAPREPDGTHHIFVV